MNNINTHIIGITGGTCSGKSYLSKSLQDFYGKDKLSIIKLDSYYHDLSHLKFSEREKNNFDHPQSFDYDLLYNHINNLLIHKEVEIPIYDYKTHTRTKKTNLIKKTNIIIIEGILVFYNKKIRDLINLKFFLDKPCDLRKELRLKRDIKSRDRTEKSINAQYNNSVQPMYKEFIEKTKKYADVIIKEDSIVNSNAFAILSNEINKILN